MTDETPHTSKQESITVGELKEQWRRDVDEAAKRCDIMVGSLNLWPICAASAFVDACDRLTKARMALETLYPGLVLDLRHAEPDDDKDAMRARIKTVEEGLSND